MRKCKSEHVWNAKVWCKRFCGTFYTSSFWVNLSHFRIIRRKMQIHQRWSTKCKGETGRLLYRTATKSTHICFHSMQKRARVRYGSLPLITKCSCRPTKIHVKINVLWNINSTQIGLHYVDTMSSRNGIVTLQWLRFFLTGQTRSDPAWPFFFAGRRRNDRPDRVQPGLAIQKNAASK